MANREARMLGPIFSLFATRHSLFAPSSRRRGNIPSHDDLDLLSFAHEVLSLHDHARAVRNAGDPHERLLVLGYAHRHEGDDAFLAHGTDADVATGRDRQRRSWNPGRRDG